ncbi:alpha/beta hydrolase [Mycobacterium sp. C31M]
MLTSIPTRRIDFLSRGIRCAGWLTIPPDAVRHPAVVLAHGLGATHDMMLATYEQAFAAAGIATLAFDYRHTGASGGEPRQRISIPAQCDDVRAAFAWLTAHPGIDARRVGLWGTSLGAMNVVRAAAGHPEVAAAIIQCPIVSGPGAARRLGVRHALRLTPFILEDLLRRAVRRGRRHIPIVGPPGTSALVTVPGALEGWNSTVPAGGEFDNRITASDALTMITTSALPAARRVAAPILVCACDQETLMNPAYAIRVAENAPNGTVKRYPSDHFAIYHPPLVDGVLADQIAFLREHLDVRS